MHKNISEIKVLNIAQPNAYNVIFSGKNIENKSAISYFRGTIAIYGSATYSKHRFENSAVKRADCNFGCIIGFVDIVDCIIEEEVTEKYKEWFHGPYGYVLENVRVLDSPISVKPPQGAITWWTLKGEQVKNCLDQIDLSTYKEIVKVAKDSTKPVLKKGAVKHGKLVPSVALSSIVGIAPQTISEAKAQVIDYVYTEDLFIKPHDENNYSEYKCIIDKKLKHLTDQEFMLLGFFNDLVSDHMEAAEAKTTKLRPSKMLSKIIGDKPLSLLAASKKLFEYLDAQELFEYESDEDIVGWIVPDKSIKELVNKDHVLFEELAQALRENLKS